MLSCSGTERTDIVLFAVDELEGARAVNLELSRLRKDKRSFTLLEILVRCSQFDAVGKLVVHALQAENSGEILRLWHQKLPYLVEDAHADMVPLLGVLGFPAPKKLQGQTRGAKLAARVALLMNPAQQQQLLNEESAIVPETLYRYSNIDWFGK